MKTLLQLLILWSQPTEIAPRCMKSIHLGPKLASAVEGYQNFLIAEGVLDLVQLDI